MFAHGTEITMHYIRVGAELTLEKMIHDALLTNYGDFRFNTNNPRGTRNATADWLLGLPATMNQDAPTTKVNNSWYYAFFLHDEGGQSVYSPPIRFSLETG